MNQVSAAKPTAGRYLQALIAGIALAGIAAHLVLRYTLGWSHPLSGVPAHQWPLILALLLGGAPLVVQLIGQLMAFEFRSDLLAGISIVTSVFLGEYLAGTLVVLMLSGGGTLEAYAVRNASSVLESLARRMPAVAHRKTDGKLTDVPLDRVAIGDELVIFPHESCPVDGTVLAGHGVMDESYLTGEPYLMSKTPGSQVLSGAINRETALTIRADKLARDSRYAKIMEVMRLSEQRRPRLRRLADQLGAYYTPIALLIAVIAWLASGEPTRFLAVLVIATPCPLLIAIPVAIIGSISLSARCGIIIKDPAVLEQIDRCHVAIFDKTGTLTYGEPRLVKLVAARPFGEQEVLSLTASLERYSKHPLARPILAEAKAAGLPLFGASEISERPGEGLRGIVQGRRIQITNRAKLPPDLKEQVQALAPPIGGMECVILVDDQLAGVCLFRDEPRAEGAHFIRHLGPRHRFDRLLLVSGDRESEVRYLADKVGIKEVYFSQTPEQKLDLVRAETRRAHTVFLGDGINDAPALTAATVGIAFGANSDVASEAARVVILDNSLEKVDEFFHISRRMRSIALQSAIGGMALSVLGMFAAARGYLPPVWGAIGQELIDVLAVVNALRVALPPKSLTDYKIPPVDDRPKSP